MNFPGILRTIGAVLAAVFVVFLLLILVELYSSVVHPLPPGFQPTQQEMCDHVARYPHWVLATVVPMWAAISFIGVWIAGRWGRRLGAGVIAMLLLAALGMNVLMLPYPLWFKIVQPMAIIAAIAAAFRSTPDRRAPIAAAPPVVQ